MNPEAWENVPIAGPMMRPKDAAEYLGIGTVTLYEEIKQGRLPPLVRISARAKAMPKSLLDYVIASRFSESMKGSRRG